MFGAAPFVLFEDVRPGGAAARLFAGPAETIVAWTLDEIEPAFEQLRRARARGLYAAGWLSYEAGVALERRLMERARPSAPPKLPLLWFGLFERMERVSSAELASALPDAAGAWIAPPRPRVTRDAYEQAFNRAKDYITAGDIYQVNLSYRADLAIAGHPLAAYTRLRSAGQGGWSGVVFDGANWLLSTSPELFFQLTDGVAETRPMKGTAKRRADPDEDRAAAEALRNDPKEIAENLMIVDLIRNDLSRLAKRGSVRTPELFRVETYPTLHTLTSTVRAALKDEYDVIDALRALFPCGSITGAPKIRAMEIIHELEADQRGAYTGSIGWMSPEGDAEFNVAIRTLAVADGKAELGLGSAVVYDSDAAREWEECQTKGAFVTRGAPAFELIETMRCERGQVARLDLHVARLSASAEALGFRFDVEEAKAKIQAVAAAQAAPCIVRLTLGLDGAVVVSTKPLPRMGDAPMDVVLMERPVAAHDFRIRHKTTLRDFHERARSEADADEVVYFDAEGFVTEGSYTSVFVERDSVLLTPPLRRGLLPGVLRQALLVSGEAREHDLRVSDLSDGFFIGNSVRGLVRARLRADEAIEPETRRAARA